MGFREWRKAFFQKMLRCISDSFDLIFADGTGLPDIRKTNTFLCEILNIDNGSLSKERRKRDIAAAMLYSMMIVGPFRRAENHASVVKIMVSLLSLIFYIVDKHQLEDKYWDESYKIIWKDILSTAELLEAEVNAKGFDAAFTSPFDMDLISFRKHSAVLTIYPLKLSQFIAGNDRWETVIDPDVIHKYKGVISLWGEASLIPPIFLILLFKNLKDGKNAAINLSKDAVL